MSDNNNLVIDTDDTQLSVKHRPKTIDELVGQEHIVPLVKGIVSRKKKTQAILIVGPSGAGKTTLARLIAYEINGIPYGTRTNDITEQNIGEDRSIEMARGLAQKIKFRPEHKFRVMILDEAHALIAATASALLKPIEEPPKHGMWILCTDRPDKIPIQIRNRCVKIELKRPAISDIVKLLARVAKREKVLQPYDTYKDVIKRIAVVSEGIPREALQVFQRVAIELEDNAKLSSKEIQELVTKIIRDDPERTLDASVSKILYGIYSGKASAIVKACNDIQDFKPMAWKILDFNKALSDFSTDVNRWYAPEIKALMAMFGKKKVVTSIEGIMKVHAGLCDLRIEAGNYAIEEKHLFPARLCGLIQKPKEADDDEE